MTAPDCNVIVASSIRPTSPNSLISFFFVSKKKLVVLKMFADVMVFFSFDRNLVNVSVRFSLFLLFLQKKKKCVRYVRFCDECGGW